MPMKCMRLILPRTSQLSVMLLLFVTGPAVAQMSRSHERQQYDKGQGATLEALTKQLSSDDPVKRLEAVKALGSAKDSRAVGLLIQATSDSDVRVQAKAIQVLGDMRASEATPALVERLLLRTSDPNMNQLILASLGKIGDTRAAQPLTEFLHRDLDAPTRGTAVYALGEIGASESVEALDHLAQTDPDETIRRLAREAKAKIEAHHAVIHTDMNDRSEQLFVPQRPSASGTNPHPAETR